MAADEPVRIALRQAASAADLAAAAALFRDYAASLTIDLCFQNFDAEVAALPGAYAPPAGRLLLAFVDDVPAACGALRPLLHAEHPRACEMKRLFVRPPHRGYGLGRRLAQRLLDEARGAGYDAMLLDTLESMASARALYASLGFVDIAPYYRNPVAGTRYLKAELS